MQKNFESPQRQTENTLSGTECKRQENFTRLYVTFFKRDRTEQTEINIPDRRHDGVILQNYY